MRIFVARREFVFLPQTCPLSAGCSVLAQDLIPSKAWFYHCLPSGLGLTLGIKPPLHLAGEVLPAQLPPNAPRALGAALPSGHTKMWHLGIWPSIPRGFTPTEPIFS